MPNMLYGYGGYQREYTPKPGCKRFCGLRNAGATCYMNSLLQTLFMTPEFRKIIFEFRWDEARDGPKSECIPYQLQLLFARLAVYAENEVYATQSTEGLRKSFGWKQNDAYHQEDIQELNRLLFDALERATKEDETGKGTAESESTTCNKLHDMYCSRVRSLIHCLRCGRDSGRVEDAYDFQLPLKDNFIESLSSYITAETLTKENRYACETCSPLFGKQDAHKGSVFSTDYPNKINEPLPLSPILTFQLQRFDMDWERMMPVKNNSSLAFPLWFNARPFINHMLIESENSQGTVNDGQRKDQLIIQNNKEFVDKVINTYKTDTKKEEETDIYGRPITTSSSYLAGIPDSIQWIFNYPKLDETPKIDPIITKTGPDNMPVMYSLFSVCVHSGGSGGGHYYAFIRDCDCGLDYNGDNSKEYTMDEIMESIRFYEFNDSSVMPATLDDIYRTFGETEKKPLYGGIYGYSSNYGTTAYLLYYRKINITKIVPKDMKSDVVQVNNIGDEDVAKEDKQEAKTKSQYPPTSLLPKDVYDEVVAEIASTKEAVLKEEEERRLLREKQDMELRKRLEMEKLIKSSVFISVITNIFPKAVHEEPVIFEKNAKAKLQFNRNKVIKNELNKNRESLSIYEQIYNNNKAEKKSVSINNVVSWTKSIIKKEINRILYQNTMLNCNLLSEKKIVDLGSFILKTDNFNSKVLYLNHHFSCLFKNKQDDIPADCEILPAIFSERISFNLAENTIDLNSTEENKEIKTHQNEPLNLSSFVSPQSSIYELLQQIMVKLKEVNCDVSNLALRIGFIDESEKISETLVEYVLNNTAILQGETTQCDNTKIFKEAEKLSKSYVKHILKQKTGYTKPKEQSCQVCKNEEIEAQSIDTVKEVNTHKEKKPKDYSNVPLYLLPSTRVKFLDLSIDSVDNIPKTLKNITLQELINKYPILPKKQDYYWSRQELDISHIKVVFYFIPKSVSPKVYNWSDFLSEQTKKLSYDIYGRAIYNELSYEPEIKPTSQEVGAIVNSYKSIGPHNKRNIENYFEYSQPNKTKLLLSKLDKNTTFDLFFPKVELNSFIDYANIVLQKQGLSERLDIDKIFEFIDAPDDKHESKEESAFTIRVIGDPFKTKQYKSILYNVTVPIPIVKKKENAYYYESNNEVSTDTVRYCIYENLDMLAVYRALATISGIMNDNVDGVLRQLVESIGVTDLHLYNITDKKIRLKLPYVQSSPDVGTPYISFDKVQFMQVGNPAYRKKLVEARCIGDEKSSYKIVPSNIFDSNFLSLVDYERDKYAIDREYVSDISSNDWIVALKLVNEEGECKLQSLDVETPLVLANDLDLIARTKNVIITMENKQDESVSDSDMMSDTSSDSDYSANESYASVPRCLLSDKELTQQANKYRLNAQNGINLSIINNLLSVNRRPIIIVTNNSADIYFDTKDVQRETLVLAEIKDTSSNDLYYLAKMPSTQNGISANLWLGSNCVRFESLLYYLIRNKILVPTNNTEFINEASSILREVNVPANEKLYELEESESSIKYSQSIYGTYEQDATIKSIIKNTQISNNTFFEIYFKRDEKAATETSLFDKATKTQALNDMIFKPFSIWLFERMIKNFDTIQKEFSNASELQQFQYKKAFIKAVRYLNYVSDMSVKLTAHERDCYSIFYPDTPEESEGDTINKGPIVDNYVCFGFYSLPVRIPAPLVNCFNKMEEIRHELLGITFREFTNERLVQDYLMFEMESRINIYSQYLAHLATRDFDTALLREYTTNLMNATQGYLKHLATHDAAFYHNTFVHSGTMNNKIEESSLEDDKSTLSSLFLKKTIPLYLLLLSPSDFSLFCKQEEQTILNSLNHLVGLKTNKLYGVSTEEEEMSEIRNRCIARVSPYYQNMEKQSYSTKKNVMAKYYKSDKKAPFNSSRVLFHTNECCVIETMPRQKVLEYCVAGTPRVSTTSNRLPVEIMTVFPGSHAPLAPVIFLNMKDIVATLDKIYSDAKDDGELNTKKFYNICTSVFSKEECFLNLCGVRAYAPEDISIDKLISFLSNDISFPQGDYERSYMKKWDSGSLPLIKPFDDEPSMPLSKMTLKSPSAFCTNDCVAFVFVTECGDVSYRTNYARYYDIIKEIKKSNTVTAGNYNTSSYRISSYSSMYGASSYHIKSFDTNRTMRITTHSERMKEKANNGQE